MKLLRRQPEWTRRVLRTLHEEGVPVMAGTDVYGIPWLVPGASLHEELELLVRSGFSAYEALRSATVVPAEYLGKGSEWGTLAPGRRADVVLVPANPLQDVRVLRRPEGVMARGVYRDRAALDALLAGLGSR